MRTPPYFWLVGLAMTAMRPPCCQGSESTYVNAGSAVVCQRKHLISQELSTPIRADTIVAEILDRINQLNPSSVSTILQPGNDIATARSARPCSSNIRDFLVVHNARYGHPEFVMSFSTIREPRRMQFASNHHSISVISRIQFPCTCHQTPPTFLSPHTVSVIRSV
jgi:hypothetical protein